jgi:hypothetical protein
MQYSEHGKSIYKQITENVNMMIKQTYRSCIKEIVGSIRSSTKSFWHFIWNKRNDLSKQAMTLDHTVIAKSKSNADGFTISLHQFM